MNRRILPLIVQALGLVPLAGVVWTMILSLTH
jgi:hypothetical protein